MNQLPLIVLTLLFLQQCAFLQTLAPPSTNKTLLLNYCMNSNFHKKQPGRETQALAKECSPWQEHACCTNREDERWLEKYNFDLHHCGKISAQCERYFKRDLCFVECEPSVGLWVQPVNRKISRERMYQVPLCQSECNGWFDACKDDLTCKEVWPKFQWRNGVNKCGDSPCIPFRQMYRNASHFCEAVWDNSWKVVSDTEPCMKVWFDPANGNPNQAVAAHYIEKVLGNGAIAETVTAGVMFTLMRMILPAVIALLSS